MNAPDFDSAIHEAAHAVVAWLVGLPPMSIGLSKRDINGESVAGFVMVTFGKIESIEQARNIILVCLAGRWAECHHHKVPFSLDDMNDTSDMKKAREAAFELCRFGDVKMSEAEDVIDSELWRAKTRLDEEMPTHFASIRRMAETVYTFQMSIDNVLDGVTFGALKHTARGEIEAPTVLVAR